uniref:Uncharacterized protein n=1 Tax=Micrurus surinamensis TaxID=129470 RepID=A0A2D4Q5X1_MICSU
MAAIERRRMVTDEIEWKVVAVRRLRRGRRERRKDKERADGVDGSGRNEGDGGDGGDEDGGVMRTAWVKVTEAVAETRELDGKDCWWIVTKDSETDGGEEGGDGGG